MKQINIYITTLIILLFGLSGCATDEEKVSGKGTIRIGVNLDTSVKTKAGENIQGPIRLTIVKSDDKGNPVPGAPVYGYDLPTGPISLPADTYLLTAFTGENPNGRPTSKPYYVGSKKETIAAGDDKTISIECKLTTAVIAINYDGLGAYKGLEYETIVENSAGNITFSSTNNIRKGYFVPDADLSVVFRYKGEDKVWKEETMPNIVGTKAQYQYNIKFTVKDDGSETGNTGSAGVGIEVTYPSEKPNNVDIEIEIPFATDAVKIITKTNGAEIKGSFLTNTSAVVDKATFKYRQKGTTNWISETLSDKLEGILTGLQSGQSYDYEYKGFGKTPITGNFITTPEVEVNAWAKFAWLTETYNCNFEEMKKLKIQYKVNDGLDDWSFAKEIDNDLINKVLKVMYLEPNKNYKYRFVSSDGRVESNGESFNTEPAEILKNGSFDVWNKNGKIWYAGTLEEANDKKCFWDSANPATADFGFVPTTPEDSDRGKVAKLSSQEVKILIFKKFAAGNMYIGEFKEIVGTSGAKINFGRKWNTRPMALRGRFKYSPGNVNYQGSNGPNIKNKPDICALYIALVRPTSPVSEELAYLVDNTKTNTFIDYTPANKEIIAYGELPTERCDGTNNVWEEFDIPLVYRNLETKPTHLIIIASASKYGDYFTGSTSSVMYLDDFELIYGDNPVTQ